MLIIKFAPGVWEKKWPNYWVTGYPIGRRSDWCDAIEFNPLEVGFKAELQPKRVSLNKLLDFNGKKYL